MQSCGLVRTETRRSPRTARLLHKCLHTVRPWGARRADSVNAARARPRPSYTPPASPPAPRDTPEDSGRAAATAAAMDMYDFFFYGLVLVTGGLWYRGREAASVTSPETPGFRSFKAKYLTGYFLCVAGDWLQGPYVYALYSAYGFEKVSARCARCAAPAAPSRTPLPLSARHRRPVRRGVRLVNGGGHVPRLARRPVRAQAVVPTVRVPLALPPPPPFSPDPLPHSYCVMYILSCITKHWNNYNILLVGRLLGGVATSLLFSVFDAWLVCEHNARGHDPAWLSSTFSTAMFGNSVVAIVCGTLRREERACCY